MIIYFADRDINIKAQASTSLPGGFRINSDRLTEDVDSGIDVFECSVSYNDKTREELESAVSVGSYILKSGGRSDENNKNNVYGSVFQIIETEFNTKDQTVQVYAEDAGLELINRVCEAVTLTDKTMYQMLQYFVPSDWTINIIGQLSQLQWTNTWDGENTATERINSVVGHFGYDAYYSFKIENMKVTGKYVNVIEHRGVKDATAQLRLGVDINQITTKKSISDIATAFKVTGGTPKGSKVPVNLKGYSYHVIDGDEYASDYWYRTNVDSTAVDEGKIRNISACRRWASAIDPDGLIVKTYSYDDTNKARIAGQAKAQLKIDSQVGVEYTVDFVRLPEDTQVGDRVNIIDENGGLYLEARLLKIETSVTDNTQDAIVGEYVLKSSGISEQLRALAKELKDQSIDGTVLTITSSGGNTFHNSQIQTTLSATVFYGGEAITTNARLQEVFGENASIKWYQGDTSVHTGFTYPLSTQQTSINVKARLEI